MNTIVNYSEAREEAEHLSRVLRRDVEVAPVNCDCDFSELCMRCAGSGIYYELRFGFCNHLVGDATEDECDLNYCREQERAKAEMNASETFARVSAPLKSCREQEIEEREVA